VEGKRLQVEIPEKLRFLFVPHRYKVARGGRGSAKSWSFARALLVKGAAEPLRILCAREVQLSIRDSVHKLLKDQIEKMGLGEFYRVLDTEIRGANGTEFLFSGLSTHTVDSIKSFEGIDIAWVEEGQSVQKRSWDILLPTIRKDGSEVWVSYNPDLETDDTHQRFAINPQAGTVSVEVNWSDNPWWNDVLEAQRLHCQKHDSDNYDNIWEGKCRPAVEGAIYYKEIQAAQDNNRICFVPYDPMLKVHVVVDIGWNDSMSIALVQRLHGGIRIIKHIEDSRRTLDSYSAELKKMDLNWGKVWLPHDGFSGDVKTGKSVAEIMTKLGWNVPSRDEIVELPVEDGIKVARMTFPMIVFDKEGTVSLVESLKRYRRRINRATDEESAPLHDKYSHGADVFRYVCINAEQMTNEADKMHNFPIIEHFEPLDCVIGY
jgi:phage terminase large subunit